MPKTQVESEGVEAGGSITFQRIDFLQFNLRGHFLIDDTSRIDLPISVILISINVVF